MAIRVERTFRVFIGGTSGPQVISEEEASELLGLLIKTLNARASNYEWPSEDKKDA